MIDSNSHFYFCWVILFTKAFCSVTRFSFSLLRLLPCYLIFHPLGGTTDFSYLFSLFIDYASSFKKKHHSCFFCSSKPVLGSVVSFNK